MPDTTAPLLPRVAYFSMEMALDPGMNTYSGGLGVLAGDMMRSAADLAVPLVGVTLVSRLGYFRQSIQQGRQQESPAPWEPARHARALPARVRVRIGPREVWVAAWEYTVTSACPGSAPVPILLLDTDLPENDPADRTLTQVLYGGDERYRLAQEMVLGIAGVRMLAALGIEVRKYHLNEGHAAFLTLELLRIELGNGHPLEAAEVSVKSRCVFTTHTPVPAGHDQFDYPLALAHLGTLTPEPVLRTLGGAERLNMTLLALNLSGWVNGVAQRHAEVSRTMFPGREVHAITNGVHAFTWTSDAHRALFDRHVPGWQQEPELLHQIERVPLPEIGAAHAQAKQALLAACARTQPQVALQPHRLTLGFARRMTSYKRPDLLFSEVERLRALARAFPLQVVIAGKAHPRDLPGKAHIEAVHQWAEELREVLPIVFLPGYDMHIARLAVAGVDVWLNTPQRPLEASGTSGMKAALNGVPSLSVLDGWWLEGWTEGVTGWAIGPDGPHDNAVDAQSLYDKLERVVVPLFHDRPDAWLELARACIARNGAHFHSHRMLRRYVLEAYSR